MNKRSTPDQNNNPTACVRTPRHPTLLGQESPPPLLPHVNHTSQRNRNRTLPLAPTSKRIAKIVSVRNKCVQRRSLFQIHQKSAPVCPKAKKKHHEEEKKKGAAHTAACILLFGRECLYRMQMNYSTVIARTHIFCALTPKNCGQERTSK